MIDWTAFNWEAFSTISAGLAAVIGAVVVGIRQVGISERQSRILERQVKIDAMRLRSELFDRRYEVYEATAAFLVATLQGSGRPNGEVERRFLDALTAAKFLFAVGIAEQLKEVYSECNDLIFTRSALDRIGVGHQQYDATLPEKDAEQSAIVSERLRSLATIFGGELQLSVMAQLDV